MASVPDTRSQTDRAYRRLRTEILYGELMPGEELRAAKLQDRFQLGLTPIREALMRLTVEGLVSAETHRTARVTEVSLPGLADVMATRREIERLCLTEAIEHGDAAWEARIVANLHLLSRTPLPASPLDSEGAANWEEHHRGFHFALISACPSQWLLKFWTTLADHSERYRKVRLLHHRDKTAQVRDVGAEHAAIMDAVLSRDAPRAVALMTDHLRATEQSVARILAEADGTAPRTRTSRSDRRKM